MALKKHVWRLSGTRIDPESKVRIPHFTCKFCNLSAPATVTKTKTGEVTYNEPKARYKGGCKRSLITWYWPASKG